MISECPVCGNSGKCYDCESKAFVDCPMCLEAPRPTVPRVDWPQLLCVLVLIPILCPFLILGALVDLAETLYRWYRQAHD